MAKITEYEKWQKYKRIFYEVQRLNPARVSELADILTIPERTLRDYITAMENSSWIYRESFDIYPLEIPVYKIRPIDIDPEEGMMLSLALRLFMKSQDRRNMLVENMLIKITEALIEDIGINEDISRMVNELVDRPEDKTYTRNLKNLFTAYINKQRIQITYRPLNQRPYQVIIEPYLFEPSLYGMTAYVYSPTQDGEMRQYKIERIEETQLLDEKYHISPDFDGFEFLKYASSVIGGTSTTEVILQFSPRVRQRINENQWFRQEQRVELPDGGIELTLHVAHLLDLKPWIRSWGADCEVISPPDLRDEMTGEARAFAELYNIETSDSDIDYSRFDDMFGED